MNQISNIQFSIIIPTFNRVNILWESIRPLAKQLNKHDEIILIDQNNPKLVIPEDLQDAPLKIFHQEKPSLTKARNTGIAKAQGSHILFVDDDVYPDEQLLHNMQKAIEKHPGKVIAGAVDQEDLPEVEGVGTINLQSGEIKTNYSSPVEMQVDMFPGCHFLLPRSCCLPEPGFCIHFKGSAQGEEIDYALRLKKAGIKIQFYPAARLFHRKESDGGCRSENYRSNFYHHHCYNEGLFYGRHGHLRYTMKFFKRLKNFIEFNSRKAPTGHSLVKVLSGFFMLGRGFTRGVITRMFL